VLADDGSVYIGGMTTSPDFPGVRAGQEGVGGQQDGFIARLRPGVTGSLQSMLIGGQGNDRIADIDLNPSGDLILVGSTDSADFPVKQAFQSKLAGNTDGFVAKLNTSDWKMSFATYFGGSQRDAIWALRVGAEGQLVVSGSTESADFPTSERAFQRQPPGKSNAFVATLRSDGRQLVWSTYYGGSGETYGVSGVEVDQAGRVWFIGMTKATNLPIRTAHQSAFGGGEFNGFLAALSPDGHGLCYSSYFGGQGRDGLEGIAVTDNKVYATGLFSSRALIQTHLQIQPAFGGGPFDAVLLGVTVRGPLSCH
jgi:hypothetical protein